MFMQRTACLFSFYFVRQKISIHSVGSVHLLSFPSLKSSDSTLVMQKLSRLFYLALHILQSEQGFFFFFFNVLWKMKLLQ